MCVQPQGVAISIVLAAVSSVLLTGCWPANVKDRTAPVSGKVMYKGKPLTQGQIVMVHNSGKMCASEIQSDGSYRLEAVVGENKIMVDSRDQKNLSQISPRQGRPLQRATSTVPERYSDYMSSGLKLMVVEGTNHHDFDLTN
jgi:hypothetical protein